LKNNKTFQKHYNRLNEQQKEAVDTVEGPVMVIAGPGSGKTEILSMRVANILRKTDAPASSILCLTFTESAAINMRERLADLIGPDAYDVAIHTFHSFGSEIIEKYPEYFHQGQDRQPADELAKLEILQDIFEQMSYDNPLNSQMPSGEFVYLQPAKHQISNLKEAGLSPDELQQILDHNQNFAEKANPIFTRLFESRISKSILEEIPQVLHQLKEISTTDFLVDHFGSLQDKIIEQFELAFSQAKREDKTSPITDWKNNFLKKNEDKQWVIESSLNYEKLSAFCEVYQDYQTTLYERGLYDFTDMILETIQALKNEPELRHNLQEHYLYLLIDEFQDTNDAQMRLLENLINMQVTDGRPNIFAVGDDDQAIFKFQGANIRNLSKFQEKFIKPEIITLRHNYRSTQDILDMARDVIVRGENRLEYQVEQIEKELNSAHSKRDEGEIEVLEEKTRLHEYHTIANKIQEKLDGGLDPEEVAVITRKHKTLKSISKVLRSFDIPVSYEKRENVFDQQHIQELVQIVRFVDTLFRKDKSAADEFLPEILSFPFWSLDRSDIWRISLKADRTDQLWLEVMLEDNNDRVNEIAHFLLELGRFANNATAEQVLAKIIGTEEFELSRQLGENISNGDSLTFSSPFKDYYFSDQEYEENTESYIDFLSSLKVFIGGLREFKQDKTLNITDVVEFVGMHQQNDIELIDNSPFATSESAVKLLTAHKAKGQEFNTVFVAKCQNKEWTKTYSSGKLKLPINLPLAPDADTLDDHLRLFYVAITRAKHNLYLTSHKFSDKGKKRPLLRFIHSDSDEDIDLDKEEVKQKEQKLAQMQPELKSVLEQDIGIKESINPDSEEKSLLQPVLENYQLSVTHLNNYLNVAEGGPKKFLEQNLLQFPQPKTTPLIFGSAMHQAIQKFYYEFKQQESLPGQDTLLGFFESALNQGELTKDEFEDQLEKGQDALSTYYKQKKSKFSQDHIIEKSFSNQGVKIDEAELRGKIDKIEQVDKNELKVYDFKTGSALSSWKGKSKYDKIKAWRYKNQLVFYKILVENSREFGNKFTVNTGELEFLEPKDNEIKSLSLSIGREDVDRIKKLTKALYKKIHNLEFSDASEYKDTIKGIKNFESDLLSEL
jgi:DNA helicase-2/ATP-dependent DNA helicase PcrA